MKRSVAVLLGLFVLAPAVAGCSITPKEWRDLPERKASLGPDAQAPEAGDTKAVQNRLRVVNNRWEPATIYVNGRWRATVYARSSAWIFVGGTPGTRTTVYARCPSGFYLWEVVDLDVWNGYLSLY